MNLPAMKNNLYIYLEPVKTWLENYFGVKSRNAESGFIGPVPYLLILRWLIALGILLRTCMNNFEDFAESDHASFFSYAVESKFFLQLVLVILVLAIAVAMTMVTKDPDRRKNKISQAAVIILDIVLITALYNLTDDPESDTYLFYYLPIFSTTEFFGLRSIFLVFISITSAFAFVLYTLFAEGASLIYFFFRIFLPREVFFLSTLIVSSYLRATERKQNTLLQRREKEMQGLLDFRVEFDKLFDMDQVLDLVQNQIEQLSTVEACHVSLVNYQTGRLELRSYTNSNYILREHYLEIVSPYEVELLTSTEPEIVSLHENPALQEAFNDRIAQLLYVPILTHNTILGFICLGTTQLADVEQDLQQYIVGLSGLLANTIERIRLFNALRDISSQSASMLKLDSELNRILFRLTDECHGDYAAISFVDNYRDRIEMHRGRNIASGWQRRSRYPLEDDDILASVARSNKTEIITDWDDRLNLEIYERYGHDKLDRIFIPLRHNGDSIGAIEVSANKKERSDFLRQENIDAIERIGKESSSLASKIQPHRLLELICQHAQKIIGADSASIHVYRNNEVIRQAGTGRTNSIFIRKHPPRPDGSGYQAIQQNKPMITDDPERLEADHPALYETGLRAKGAFPLSIDENVTGVLYIHFGRSHKFSQAEIELISVFARQAELVVQNHLLLEQLNERTADVWTLTSFQQIIQSLESGTVLSQVLGNVAQHMLYMLDADNVTLYQFFQEQNRFEFPPTMAGHFADRDAMLSNISASSVVWDAVNHNHMFIDNVETDEWLRQAMTHSSVSPNFIEREKVKSTVILTLKAREQECVGLLFVNYREQQEFTEENRQVSLTLAASAALAIKTARLYEQANDKLSQSEHEIQALRVVTQAIVSHGETLDLDKILDSILAQAMKLTDAPVGSVMWYDKWTNTLRRKAFRGYPSDIRPLEQQMGEGIIGQAAEEKRTIHMSDVHGWPGKYLKNVPNTRCELAVPLHDDSELFGVIDIQSSRPNAFDENVQDLLEQIALLAIIAIRMADSQKTALANQELATLGTLTGTLQHRLSNTIDVIMPAIKLIREHIPCDIDQRVPDTLDLIERNARNASSVFDSIFDSSDVQPRVKTDIADLIKGVIHKTIETRKHGNIQFRFSEVYPMLESLVYADEPCSQQSCTIKINLEAEEMSSLVVSQPQISEVFQIVLENGVRAICDKSGAECGEISIRLRHCPEEPRRFIEAEISDDGIGIEEKIQERLFKQPVPRKEPSEGAGFGLWISNLIVRSHGGSIRLKDSAQGTGSTFLIRLPCTITNTTQDMPGGNDYDHHYE